MIPPMPARHFLYALASLGLLACSTATAPPAAETGNAPPPAGTPSAAPPSDATPPADTPPADAPTPAGWGPTSCPAAGTTGFDVGQTIGQLKVKDCATGADATIDEVCGASATWIFTAHTHCPTCQATAGFTDEVAAAVASKNVGIVQIVYDDNGTSCAKWKAAYKLAGLSNVRVYEDPTGAVWETLKTSNYTAPSTFLDSRRVITHKEHSLSKAEVLKQIDVALASK